MLVSPSVGGLQVAPRYLWERWDVWGNSVCVFSISIVWVGYVGTYMWLGRMCSGVLILAVVSGLVFIRSYLVCGLDMSCGVDKLLSLTMCRILWIFSFSRFRDRHSGGESLHSCTLDPVRVITGGSIVWGEWDSEAARGMWWGCTVIPRLTKIIRSGITFVSQNVISLRFL